MKFTFPTRSVSGRPEVTSPPHHVVMCAEVTRRPSIGGSSSLWGWAGSEPILAPSSLLPVPGPHGSARPLPPAGAALASSLCADQSPGLTHSFPVCLQYGTSELAFPGALTWVFSFTNQSHNPLQHGDGVPDSYGCFRLQGTKLSNGCRDTGGLFFLGSHYF